MANLSKLSTVMHKHPQYKYLLDSSKKNYFDIAKFLSRRLTVKPDDVYECCELEAPWPI